MPTPAVTAVTVSAWAGSTNLGDELILSALLAKLRRRGVTPCVLSVDPGATTATHGVRSIGAAALLRGRAGRPGAVLLGGGGLLQDETSPFNLPFHLGRTSLAAVGGRPVAGIGLGVGPVGGRTGKALVRRALRGAVATSVRDRGSQDLLRTMGVESLLAADLALSLAIPQVEVEGRLAVSLRPWTGTRHLVPVGLRHRTAPATPAWFVPQVARALDAIARRTGLGIHLVALQADGDHELHVAVADRMTGPATAVAPDVGHVVAEIASCEAVVAMRYHAGIAAVLGGRPAVLIGYSPKVPSLAAEARGGLEGLTWDEGSLADLPEAVDRVLGRGAAVVEGRERLRARERVNDDVIDRLLASDRS